MTNNSKAAFLALISTALITGVAALSKAAVVDYHVLQILFFRQCIVFLSTLPQIIQGFPNSLKTKNPKVHVVRLAGAFVGLTCSIWAVGLLPLTTATTLAFSQTFFMAILAFVFLRETVGVHRIGAIIVGFIGVLIVVRPGNEGFANLGTLVAIAGALGAAVAFISVPWLSQTETTATLIAYQTVFVGILAAIPMLWLWKTPDLEGWALLISVGLLAVPAQWIGVAAVRLGESSLLANIQYAKLLYAGLLGYFIFGEVPDRYTLIGATVIIASALYIFHRESKRQI
ncbi:MAG: drug/metabolite transporter (DMT)-like permease [Ascidiaceihabitans sp.]|jgi:drug/metabolite transporter (DMT)-like permease